MGTYTSNSLEQGLRQLESSEAALKEALSHLSATATSAEKLLTRVEEDILAVLNSTPNTLRTYHTDSLSQNPLLSDSTITQDLWSTNSGRPVRGKR